MKKLKRSLKQLMAAILAGVLAFSGSMPALAEETVFTEELLEEDDGTQAESSDELLREDYYEYVNKDLLDSVEIPSTDITWANTDGLSNEVQQTLNEILEDTLESYDQNEKGSNEQMIADYYLTCIDTDTRDSVGLGQLQEYVDAYKNADSIQEYVDADAKLFCDTGIGSIFDFSISVDTYDSTIYELDLGGMKMGLEDSVADMDLYADVMPEYEAYIALTLKTAGYEEDEAKELAADILDLFDEIDASMDQYDDAETEDYYNPYTIEELDELYSNADMNTFLAEAGLDGWDTVIVLIPETCELINEKLVEDNLDLLKAYSIFSLETGLAGFLSTELAETLQALISAPYGIEAQDEEVIAAQEIQYVFDWEFAQLYVEQAFSEQQKEDITEMIQTFIDHYRERIEGLDWMEEETKEAAIRKLDAMVVQVGYPDEWPQKHNDVEILGPDDGGCCIDNALNIMKANHKYTMEKQSGEVDRYEWAQLPTEVNACYEVSSNTILFPDAILQAPFYDPDASKAQNYGAIGMVIAHEITHAFDSNGSQYDENGNYNPWWTEADAEKFEDMTQQVVDYYDTFVVDGIQVDGALTLDENIADLGSLNTITSFFEDDPEQLDELFRSFANLWAIKYTPEGLEISMDTDTHSLFPVRVNATLRTLDCFYETYPEIQEGDPMYLAPEDRVRIW